VLVSVRIRKEIKVPVWNQPGFARVTAICAIGLSCLTAAACSSGSSSTVGGGAGNTAGSTPSVITTSPTANPNPLAGLTAQQVLTKAIDDAKAASSLTMVGTVNDSGSLYTLNLGFKKGEGCSGTIAVAGKGSFDLTIIGSTAYLKPDNKFWRSYAGAQANAVISLLGGRYIKGSTSNSNVASLSKLCDINGMLTSFKAQGKVSKGAVTTLDGKQVLPLKDSKGGTMWVTNSSTPEIVVVANLGATGGSSGKVTFGIDAPVTLTAPPADKVLDGSSLGF
jgi:hypothetical protein